MINVNLDKAREIHKDRIRMARKPLLDAADVAYMRALETGDVDSITKAVLLKQQLRDAPADPAIESATTTEELRSAWNTQLLGDSSYQN